MFHICCNSFGDMENDMGGHGFILDIDFLDRWEPFHSKNGSCDLRCVDTNKQRNLTFNSLVNIWAPILKFGTWSIGDLWKLVKLNYGSSMIPSWGTMLNTTHGFIDNFQGKDKYVEGNDVKS
jgi:hypothetical protein